MNTRLLFPHRYRLIGWLIFLPSAFVGLVNLYTADVIGRTTDSTSALNNMLSIAHGNMVDELAGIGLIVGLLLIAFSKEKTEDEMISQLRLKALQWSVYANYLILAVAILTLYDVAFFNVMIYNMFTVLLVFIARFRWLIYKNDKLLTA
ncbi:hypothetical protein [Fibrella aquatilis]|uniref:Uncharacterized protein n=1 Tax=Fibrella aquatilis TaxID=2817059 RepID=A0A939G3L6_9BACT|nr:hypothetical protein [Fibrella aquatilis]MBO0930583.1 hypothetical protein [Fibrella aquatilis]